MRAIRPLGNDARRTVDRVSYRISSGIQSLRQSAATLSARAQDSRIVGRFPAQVARRVVAGRGYIAAVAGVMVISLIIALALAWMRISNISLLYLLPVLWLAAVYGRGPAIFASVLSFLAYNFFFIPPFHVFIVDDPTEWISLLALLVTALVLGQLTATVQAHAHEARESQQRTAILYSIAQLIVTTTDQERIYTALTERMVEVFTPQGVRACSLILPGESANVRTQAVSPAEGHYTDALSLDLRDNAGFALWALEHDAAVGGSHRVGQDGLDVQVFFVPLRSGRRVVGALGVAGTPEIRRLIARAAPSMPPGLSTTHTTYATYATYATHATHATHATKSADHEQQVTLFAGFCGQIALALDRSALQQEAIHAEALRESDQLKDALLGSVTHELRTPLASIKAAVSSLRQPDMTWSEEERREFLQSIDSSADRLNRLVGNLLDLSRLEAGSAPPEKDWYLIGDVVATVLDRLDLTGQIEDRQITVDIPDDIPLVPMDYGQIEQVLTNLIENALKYSPAGSETRIAARARPLSELEVRVEDQGIGIPPGEREAIFDKFYRVQHAQLPWAGARPPVGTGLGLAICEAIIRAHGGRIWAESDPGHGATFVFTLPIPQDRPQGMLPDLEAPEPAITEQPPAVLREAHV